MAKAEIILRETDISGLAVGGKLALTELISGVFSEIKAYFFSGFASHNKLMVVVRDGETTRRFEGETGMDFLELKLRFKKLDVTI